MAGQSVRKADSIGTLSKQSSTEVRLSASTVTIGGLQYDTSILSCFTNISGAGGLDTGSIAADSTYYVYAALSAGEAVLVCSLSNSAPSGFTSSKLVGEFDTEAGTAIDKAYILGEQRVPKAASEYIWGGARPNVVSFSNLDVLGVYNTGARTFTASKKVKVWFNATMHNFQSNANGMSLSSNLQGTFTSVFSQTDPSVYDRTNAPIKWFGILQAGEVLTNSDTGALGGASWQGWSLLVEEIIE